jgi:hypothetical protein
MSNTTDLERYCARLVWNGELWALVDPRTNEVVLRAPNESTARKAVHEWQLIERYEL